jgi:hypothetical protein
LCEIRGRVAAQICFQEILRFWKRDVIVTLALNLKAQSCATALQKMTATLPVVR